MSELQVAGSAVNGALTTPMPNWSKASVSTTNLILPRITLMQGMSEMVNEGKAKLGDIVKSTTGEILASKDEPLEVLPLTSTEYWVIMEKIGTKVEYRGTEPLTVQNCDAPREFIKEGKEFRRDRVLDFYVLIKKEIEGELRAEAEILKGGYCDPDLCLLPALISFRRSSYRAGKEIATHMMKAAHFNMPPWTKSIRLTSGIEKTDAGTFAVFTTRPGEMSNASEMGVANKWYETITAKGTSVKAHEDTAAEVLPVDDTGARF